jgi:hypothetical protein
MESCFREPLNNKAHSSQNRYDTSSLALPGRLAVLRDEGADDEGSSVVGLTFFAMIADGAISVVFSLLSS